MLENVHVLLNVGANPNIPDHSGETALHKAAVICTDVSTWFHLLNDGGKCDLPNRERKTPLSKAKKFKNDVAMSAMSLFMSDK